MMSRQGKLAVSWLLLLLAIAMPCSARADEGPTSTAADALFREGKALMNAGRPEQACKLFAESQQLEPAGGTLLNLASCYQRIERYASAERALDEAAALAEAAGRSDAIAFVRAELAKLRPMVPVLRIVLPAGAPLGQVRLVVDGESSAVLATTTDLRVDAGSHEVVVEAVGRPSVRKSVTAAAAETTTVEIALPPITTEAAIPRVAPQTELRLPPEGGARSTSVLVPVGIAGLIVGGAAGLGGAISGGLAMSQWSDAKSRCPETQCSDPVGVSASEKARLFGDTATGLFVSGAIVAALGGALLIAGRLTTPSVSTARPWVLRF